MAISDLYDNEFRKRNQDHFASIVRVAMSDDIITDEEKEFLDRLAKKLEINAADYKRILKDYAYTCTTLTVAEGLHFQSSVNYVGNDTLLVTEDFVSKKQLKGYDAIVVDRHESYAANTLFVNNHLLIPRGYPGTLKKIEVLGFKIIELDTSEVRKMDGGLTCMSIRF